MGFSSQLRAARERKGYNQIELSAKIGRSKSTVSNYENGTSMPHLDDLIKLINVLDVDANFLLYDDLPTQIKERIDNNSVFYDKDVLMFEQLDIEDKAEIRGEMKQMLKADKYSKRGESNLA